MEIQEKNVLAAYQGADEKGQELLRNLFPDIDFKRKIDNRPVTERIKTFEDALKELQLMKEDGDNLAARLIADWEGHEDAYGNEDVEAYVKLRIIVYALNEGWRPQFTENETRWYPWHYLYTADEVGEMKTEDKERLCLTVTGEYDTEYAGFVAAYSLSAPSYTNASVGSRLCLKSSELAAYCGTQFLRLWADFKLIRK